MVKKVKENLDYRIGLDVGTTSVGWAVLDRDNNLIKYSGKNMWGVRLFEEAKKAKERRVFRGGRRRLERRRQRIALLQNMLEPMVAIRDPYFFLRMKDSFMYTDDKSSGDIKDFKYLFANKADYQKKYKSIYELRNDLVVNHEKSDPRLVYLAIHHILKYRGNFLYEGQEFNIKDTSNIREDLENLFEILEISASSDQITGIIHTLENTNQKKKDKSAEIKKLFPSDKLINEIVNAVLGYKFKLGVIADDELSESAKFSSSSYEKESDEYLELLGDKGDVLEILKKIYDWHLLSNLLKGQTSISQAMISRYNKHHKDLVILKRLIKRYLPARYNEIFRDKNISSNYLNYAAYGSRTDYKNKVSYENFIEYIKDILENSDIPKDNSDYKYCFASIESEDFLQKLRIRDNGAIPYQLHLNEMKSIIENQGEYYPVLRENRDKIISLMTFRVPYYVGPLNPHSGFAWIKRTDSSKKIYPWNFDRVVDSFDSAEESIKRMTSKCTYLPEEYVMPKNSLLYSEYCVLNEVNKLKINGDLIDIITKKDLIEQVFKNQKSVKEADVREFLKSRNHADYETVRITGFGGDKKFLASLASYNDFKKIFGEINADNTPMIEDIIRWIIIFKDKHILEKKLRTVYGNKLSDQQINQIKSLNYKGWSRLSEKLLIGIIIDDPKYGRRSIMDILRDTNQNLMQIINMDAFEKKILAEQQKLLKSDISYEDVKKIAGSPGIKRGIWQTITIVKEIAEFLGCPPKHIYLEFAREEGEKGKRTSSRYDKLSKLYKEIKDDNDYKDIYTELTGYKEKKKKLDDKRLYLYFTQNGKCMYTGESLEINDLSKYDIDHIIPQSLIKDDSLDNTVLVISKLNRDKTNNVLDPAIRGKRLPYWKFLCKQGLISEKKLSNLCKESFSDKDGNHFINRQLVETRQIIKNVANLLGSLYGSDTHIQAIKAGLISDFRGQYDLKKIRDINDLHHAHDAYICVAIGNYIQKIFPGLRGEIDYYDYRRFKKQYNQNDERNKWGFIISSMNYNRADSNGEVIWDTNEDIGKIKKILNYKDCLITKKTEEVTGAFYNMNLLSASKDIEIPIKSGMDTSRYGGYSGVQKAYYMVVEYTVSKGKKIETKREIIGIPIQNTYLIKQGKLDRDVCISNVISNGLPSRETLVAGSIKILKDKILRYQLIEHMGSLVYITSQDYIINAKPFFMDKKYQDLIYECINHKLEESDENLNRLTDFCSYYIEKLERHYPAYVKRGYVGKIKDFCDINSSLSLKFNDLSFESKIEFINFILRLVKLSSCQIDLKKTYNLITGFGMLDGFRIADDTVFIDQSITGLRVRRYTL